MKIKLSGLIIVGLLVSSCFLSELPQKTSVETEKSSKKDVTDLDKNPSVLGELYNLDEEHGNWLGLTTKQKLEDFDYLYSQLVENYPYIDMLARTQKINFEEIYHDYRTKILKSKTDFQFFVDIEMFVAQLDHTGHLSLVSPLNITSYQGTYKNVDNMTEEDAARARLLDDVFNDADISKSYEQMSDQFYNVFNEVQAFYKNKEAQSETNAIKDNIGAEQVYQNIETSIIKENKTAYINIKSFSNEFYENDKELLFDFYKSIAEYENVIIDITQNGGGGMAYFNDLIVAPNISSPMSMQVYELTKDGKINQKYLDLSQYHPIAELPELPELNITDIKNLNLFKPIQYTVEPLYETKILNGKVWLLVGSNVYSSSEYAALFSKATGFASLVGSVTSGDGIGEDPLPIILPNSNLLVMYSSVYGITENGICSAEKGTVPDVYVEGEESPLEKCLQIISEQSVK